MMHDQAAAPFVPCVAAFHDPPFRQHEESLAVRLHRKQLPLVGTYPASHVTIRRMPHHLHLDPVLLLDTRGARTRIAGIDIPARRADALQFGRIKGANRLQLVVRARTRRDCRIFFPRNNEG